MATRPRFPLFHRLDRKAVLVCTAIVFGAIASGFIYDMAVRASFNPLEYPWYVHVHALTYSSWLVLLVWQVTMVRTGNIETHKRFGRLALVILPLMLVTGPMVAIMSREAMPDPDPGNLTFMSTQFTNVLGCVPLLFAGYLLRRDPATHKRLMLMGSIAITEPGFSRILHHPLYEWLGDGVARYYFETYPGTLLLMLAVAAYDLRTRGRLHPAWIFAFCWVFANEWLASWLYYQDGFWLSWMRALTGH
ncbi:hypothetical protein [Tsuneonella mangrovi]|uniref:hypothetical protein n=1 Tax=Tsuneonella mangrovi TaxID=1982042 RepID=UPI000BA225E6|nr:hypothetical protein [Tsuneonella mangrovi]